jgi:NAD(P)-dependent dehydrogenase (short-subunit alcohol dehydrogenase family)
MFMAKRFENRVVWITGASSGLGWALALELARQGADLALSARRSDRLQALVREVEALGRSALAIPCDVREESAVREAVDKVVTHFGRLDVAIANAGFGVLGRIERLDAEAWRRQLDTNVIGLALTARYALPQLRSSHGRLVLIGSVAAHLPGPGSGAYAASKAAVRSIGATLSVECAGSGVSVTTVHPGYVTSEIGRVDNQGQFDASRPDTRPSQLMWSAERAAEVTVRAIARRKREYVFTGHGKVGAFLGQHFPGLVHALFKRTARKPRSKPRDPAAS